MKEKPIVLTPDPVSPGNHPPSPHTSPSPHSQPCRPGLSRATSVVTTHVLDLPPLPPISEERGASQERPLALSSSGSNQINPFVFPSNGFIKDDNGSPPIVMVVPPTDIVVTDVENEEMERENLSTRMQFKVGFLIQLNLR